MKSHSFELFADYFQFYIQDEYVSGIDGDSWGPEASDRMLALAPGAIAVSTIRNVTVPVTVEILETEPSLDLENWDHVTECSLTTLSGSLVVAGCTDLFTEAPRIAVTPGTYCARISGGGFDSVEKHWEDGEDRYRVQLWPGLAIEPKVLKTHVPKPA